MPHKQLLRLQGVRDAIVVYAYPLGDLALGKVSTETCGLINSPAPASLGPTVKGASGKNEPGPLVGVFIRLFTHRLGKDNQRQVQYMAGHRFISSTECYQVGQIAVRYVSDRCISDPPWGLTR